MRMRHRSQKFADMIGPALTTGSRAMAQRAWILYEHSEGTLCPQSMSISFQSYLLEPPNPVHNAVSHTTILSITSLAWRFGIHSDILSG